MSSPTESRTDRHAWSRPGAETVAPGLVRVPLPLPLDALRAVNVYVLTTPEGLTLVDGGWSIAASRDVLRDALRTLGADLADITRFLVTHVHRDHYTQAAALRRETGARVALGVGERPSVDRVAGDPSDPDPMGAQLAGLRAAGAPGLAERIRATVVAATSETDRAALVLDYAAPDDWLADGDRIVVGERTLTAVETPGHTRGHLVYATDSALFAGDHVLPHITPSIGFEPAATPGALERFLASLARVRAMPDRMLLPAHGPVGPSVHARVDQLLAHHARRLDEVAARVAAGAPTAAEVAGQLTWTRRETALADLEPFHRMLAVLETEAHLEVLAVQGRVDREIVDGVTHHRARG